MIRRIEIENFRLFERLVVEDLGRVNIIIGENNAGKTALLEAMAFAEVPAGLVVATNAQGVRTRGPVDHSDFDGVWSPFFRDLDAARGFRIATQDVSVAVRAADASQHAGYTWGLVWRIATERETLEAVALPGLQEMFLSAEDGAAHPNGTAKQRVRTIAGSPHLNDVFAKWMDQIMRDGRDDELLRMVQDVVPDIVSLQFLANSVLAAKGLANKKPLPISQFGDGSQRAVEIAAAMIDPGTLLTIDEVENGFHFKAMPPLWHWLQSSTLKQKTQLAVTTHRDECVLAACNAFKDANDDDIRVIRLDREGSQVRAVVYTRDLALDSFAFGVEIRA
jgi:ABC-type branched-subunit amino acid transport system ATPase component